MKTIDHDKLNMFSAVRHFLNLHAGKWSGDALMVQAATGVTLCIDGLNEILRIQAIDLDAWYRAKDKQATIAYEAVLKVVSTVHAWAVRNNPTLAKQLHMPRTVILGKKRAEVINSLYALLNLAAAQLPAITGHLLRPTDVATAQAAIEKFERDLAELRSVIASRKTAGKRATAFIRDCKAHLCIIDNLIPYCAESDPGFIMEYREHRKVIPTARKLQGRNEAEIPETPAEQEEASEVRTEEHPDTEVRDVA